MAGAHSAGFFSSSGDVFAPTPSSSFRAASFIFFFFLLRLSAQELLPCAFPVSGARSFSPTTSSQSCQFLTSFCRSRQTCPMYFPFSILALAAQAFQVQTPEQPGPLAVFGPPIIPVL